MSNHTNSTDTLSRVAASLVDTSNTVRDILNTHNVYDHPKFYSEFRARYQCTPTQYRTAQREIEAQRRRSAKREQESPEVEWRFEINLHAEGLSLWSQSHTERSINAHVFDASRMIVLTVNETFKVLLTVLTVQGQYPFQTVQDMIGSQYREELNDIVLEMLQPYFHGRLDIAYGFTLFGGIEPGYRVGWQHNNFSGYPRR